MDVAAVLREAALAVPLDVFAAGSAAAAAPSSSPSSPLLRWWFPTTLHLLPCGALLDVLGDATSTSTSTSSMLLPVQRAVVMELAQRYASLPREDWRRDVVDERVRGVVEGWWEETYGSKGRAARRGANEEEEEEARRARTEEREDTRGGGEERRRANEKKKEEREEEEEERRSTNEKKKKEKREEGREERRSALREKKKERAEEEDKEEERTRAFKKKERDEDEEERQSASEKKKKRDEEGEQLAARDGTPAHADRLDILKVEPVAALGAWQWLHFATPTFGYDAAARVREGDPWPAAYRGDEASLVQVLHQSIARLGQVGETAASLLELLLDIERHEREGYVAALAAFGHVALLDKLVRDATAPAAGSARHRARVAREGAALLQCGVVTTLAVGRFNLAQHLVAAPIAYPDPAAIVTAAVHAGGGPTILERLLAVWSPATDRSLLDAAVAHAPTHQSEARAPSSSTAPSRVWWPLARALSTSTRAWSGAVQAVCGVAGALSGVAGAWTGTLAARSSSRAHVSPTPAPVPAPVPAPSSPPSPAPALTPASTPTFAPELLASLLADAVALVRSRWPVLEVLSEKALPIGGSRFGGLPDLPPHVVWPSWGDEPLDFMLQIDLAEVAAAISTTAAPLSELLPWQGWLWYFFDTEKDGYETSIPQSKLLLYWDGPVTALQRRTRHPRDGATEDADVGEFGTGYGAHPLYPERIATLVPLDGTPPPLAGVSAHDLDALRAVLPSPRDVGHPKVLPSDAAVVPSGTLHHLAVGSWAADVHFNCLQLLGHPTLIQGDIFGDLPTAFDDAHWKGDDGRSDAERGDISEGRHGSATADDAGEWMLLLQIPSDRIRYCAGDHRRHPSSRDDGVGPFDSLLPTAGTLYVCIPRRDLAARRFDRTMTVYQQT